MIIILYEYNNYIHIMLRVHLHQDYCYPGPTT